jgi:small subunit ribosomal protein S17
MRTKTGVITSARMQKTVTVTVHRSVMHPMYAKRFRVSKKFLADTNGMDVAVGDEVVITECRPLSKRKCFKVTEILKKAIQLSDVRMEEVEQGTKRDHRDALAERRKKEPSPAQS